jgi:hypothetical protein
MLMENKSVTQKVFIMAFLFAVLLTSPPLKSAQADFGPKPTMEFEFVYETETAYEIVKGEQLECDLPDCSDARPLEDLGPQSFRCGLNSCSSMAYGYSDYHHLRIDFEDGKTRLSNVFRSDSFAMTYRVTVRENNLLVEKIRGQRSPLGTFLLSLVVGLFVGLPSTIAFVILAVVLMHREGEDKADFVNSKRVFIALWAVMTVLYTLLSIVSLGIIITAVVEGILGLLYAIYRDRTKLIIVTMVLLVNLVTLPILWLGAWLSAGIYSLPILIAAEFIIWLVEGGIFYLTQRKHVSLKEAFALTFILNLASFLLGLLLPI